MKSWERSTIGREPWPLVASIALFPFLALWTLPQTIGGLGFALHARLRGHRGAFYRFGPFVFYVVPWAPKWIRGISLGVVVLADDPSILTHEFCHVFTALWLHWLYLPVYGLEYLIVGHDRSPHERLTVRFEKSTRLGWRRA
ncbi:MAG: hypothetical protein ACXWP4_05870 [Polyangiales bacterium]